MTCHSIGRYPIGTMGFGMFSEYSRIRIPNPPQNKTTFIPTLLWLDLAGNTGSQQTECLIKFRFDRPSALVCLSAKDGTDLFPMRLDFAETALHFRKIQLKNIEHM